MWDLIQGLLGNIGGTSSIIGFVLGIGGVLVWAKRVLVPLKEVGDLIGAITDAIDDGKVNDEEIARIMKEYKDVKDQVKLIGDLIKRKK